MAWLVASMPRSRNGQAYPNTTPNASPASPLTMGTKRLPPKKLR